MKYDAATTATIDYCFMYHTWYIIPCLPQNTSSVYPVVLAAAVFYDGGFPRMLLLLQQ